MAELNLLVLCVSPIEDNTDSQYDSGFEFIEFVMPIDESAAGGAIDSEEPIFDYSTLALKTMFSLEPKYFADENVMFGLRFPGLEFSGNVVDWELRLDGAEQNGFQTNSEYMFAIPEFFETYTTDTSKEFVLQLNENRIAQSVERGLFDITLGLKEFKVGSETMFSLRLDDNDFVSIVDEGL
jgi:hypothetical protein